MCTRHAPARQTGPVAAAILAFVAAGPMLIGVPKASSQTTRVSVASDGTQGNDTSQQLTMTPDARLVSFFSYATNLVPGDTNGQRDVFVHDRATHTTSRVSLSSSGGQGNGDAGYAQLSADGTTIVFAGGSDNLVPADSNQAHDIFVRDLSTGTTTMVSISSTGEQGNRRSRRASISGDGRFVAFRSDATNLVPGDTNGNTDIFVHDRQTQTTTRVSVASDGTQANGDTDEMSISADGRLVAFGSFASNLVSGDTNGRRDVFVHELSTGETTRVNVADDGTQADFGWSQIALWNSLSADGRYVTFFSEATNLVPGDTNGYWDIFVHDRMTHTTTRVSVASVGSEANGVSIRSSISNDGRFVVFSSEASNLVPADTNGYWDIFVHDRLTGATTRRSVAGDGSQANYECWMESAVSTDGETVAFFTGASNLVPGDTNDRGDIFVNEGVQAAGAPLAATWSDDTVHFLFSDLRSGASFSAGAPDPAGVTSDGTLIYTGHATTQEVIAYDLDGIEQYRWSGPLSGLAGLEMVAGDLAVARSSTIDFYDPLTGAFRRTIPAPCAAHDVAFDGGLIRVLCDTQVVAVSPATGSIQAAIPNMATCASTGIASEGERLVLGCANGDWFRVDAANGDVLETGSNGLDMHALHAVEQFQLFYSQDDNPTGLYQLDMTTGAAWVVGDGHTGVIASTVGLTSPGTPGELRGTTWSDIVVIQSDGTYARVMPGSTGSEGLAYCAGNDTLYGTHNGALFTIDPSNGLRLETLAYPGVDLEGLTCDTSADLLYGIGESRDLLAYDIALDSWSTIGDTGMTWNDAGLAWHPTLGVLYAIGEQGEGNLYTIEPDTAAVTLVGPMWSGAVLDGDIYFSGGGLAMTPRLRGDRPLPLFIDGFESGDTAAWATGSDG